MSYKMGWENSIYHKKNEHIEHKFFMVKLWNLLKWARSINIPHFFLITSIENYKRPIVYSQMKIVWYVK